MPRGGMLCPWVMATSPSASDAITRIAAALDRIEAASARLSAHTSAPDDERYQALRRRTKAALETLETVIAKAGGAR